METLIGKLLEYGNTPALIVLAVLVGWLIKKLGENDQKDEKRAAVLNELITKEITTLEERIEAQRVSAEKRLDDLADRVSCVERDYLPREEHYKEFSGWRAEINRLSDLIINLFKDQGRKA
jgi:hypothetical protein